jgi:hypothetical protein
LAGFPQEAFGAGSPRAPVRINEEGELTCLRPTPRCVSHDTEQSALSNLSFRGGDPRLNAAISVRQSLVGLSNRARAEFPYTVAAYQNEKRIPILGVLLFAL